MKHLVRSILFALALFSSLALAGPVNVNTADAATLAAELQGIGDKTAAAIIAYRDEHGPFKSVEDLKMVKGVGDKIVENNKDNIRFSDSK